MFKIIFYSLLYIFLTACIIFYFVKDKYINKKLDGLINPLLSKIYSKYNIKKESSQKRVKSIFEWIYTILVAIILVLIIQTFYLANYTVPTSSMYPTIKPGDRFFADKVSYKFREPERGEIIVFKEPFNNKDRYTKRLIGLPGEYVFIDNGNVYINDVDILNNDVKYINTNTLIADKTWKIPEKGDIIELEDGIFSYNEKIVLLNELKADIKENKSIIDNIKINKAIFKINGSELTGPIYDRDILLKLIAGESVELENNYYFVLGDNSRNSFDSRYWGFVSEDRLLGRMLLRFWPVGKFGVIR